MAIEFPEVIIDIGDKNRSGMYRDFGSEVGTGINRLVRRDGVPRKFRLVRRNETETEGPWEDVNTEDAVIAFGLGEPDKEPVSGTWALSYNGSSTGLTSLAFDVSQSVLQAALNANSAVAAGGASVTVTKHKSSYVIVWNQVGARFHLIATVTGLSPEMSTNAVTEATVGDAGNPEVQIVRLVGKPYAFSDAWTPYADEGVSVTEKQAGTPTKKAVRLLRYATQPYGGTTILNFPKPEIVKITARTNAATAAAAEQFTVRVDSSTYDTTALQSKFFQAFDDVGPVYVWFNISSGGTAPTAPLGGRNLAIALLTGDSYLTAAQKIATALNADAKFNATQNAHIATVTQASAGTRAAPADISSAAAGVIVAETVTGTAATSGLLAGTYFILQELAGSLAVWFSVAGSTVPDGALAFNRQLQVSINSGDSGTAVATAIAAALTADGSYTAGSAANVVTATDSVGGERDTALAGTSGFTIKIAQSGKAITAVVAYNAPGADVQAALEGYWLVTKRGYNYVLNCSVVGDQPGFSVDSDGLIYPNGISGELNLNTLGMFLAFANTEDDYLSLVFEGKIQFPGQLPFTFYRETVPVYREVIDLDSLAPTPTVTISEMSGVVDLAIAADNQPVVFVNPLAAAPTKFELALLIPSGGDLFMFGVDLSTVTVNGFTIHLGGGGASGSGYKIAWKAKF